MMTDQDDDARHGIGGNNPPVPTPADIARFLADSELGLLTRRDDLLDAVARFKGQHARIDDDETQGKAGDFAKQISAAIKQTKDAFTVAKKPFLDGGRAVESFFKTISEPLEKGLDEVRRPMNAYALRLEEQKRAERAEAARLAREESDRIQRALAADRERAAAAVTIEQAIVAADTAERTEREATAKAADLTRNRGDLGSVSSLREYWDVEVQDISQVPPEFLAFDYAKARKHVLGGRVREIPGCRVFVTKHIVTR
jgi:hypothetical protein